MMFSKLIAYQLGHPSGLIGQLILGPMWNRRNRALNDVTLDQLALRPDDRVLEVGFGGGYLLSRMSALVTAGGLAGVDVSPAMVNFCQTSQRALIRAGRLEVKCAAAEALPYTAGCFTKVCSVNSIFYWSNVSQAMAEFWRVLTDDGTLVLTFTGRQSLQHRGFAQHGLNLLDVDQVQQMMAGPGFRDIHAIRASDKHRQFVCMIGRK